MAKKTRNLEIRNDIKKSGVCSWEVAEKLGVSGSHFSVLLRQNLSDDQKSAIYKAIEAAKEGN